MCEASARPAAGAREPEGSLVFVGSNFHSFFSGTPLSKYEGPTDGKSFPKGVTLGFRSNLWRVFSELAKYESAGTRVSWLGRQWTVVSIWVADSRDVEFASHFDDPVNVFLIFVLRPDLELDKPIRSLIFDQECDEQAAVAQLVAACATLPSHRLLRTFRHKRDLNGLFLWTARLGRVTEATAVALFAYHSFALLLIWIIGREQTNISLLPDDSAFSQQMTKSLRLGGHISNVERFILTRNVSNDPEVQRLAVSLRTQFGLRRKMNSLRPLNEAIQRQLDTWARIRDDSKSAALNFIALVVAVVGVPVTIVSMLLALDESVPTVANGLSYLGRSSLLSFFLTATFLSVVFMAIGAIIAFAFLRIAGRRR